MSEIAVRPDHQPVHVPAIPTRLVEWADEARAAHSLAQSLCSTSFAPTAFRGKPAEATAAILAGSEVGLSPMAALNAYDVIQGRPAPKAMTLRALVQSQGHEVWIETSTETKCVAKGRRKGSDREQTVEWTIQRAQRLSLTGKDQWQKQPQAMLIARATAEICRLVAADVILGVPYAAEELEDETPAPTRTVKRGQRSQPEPEPTPEPNLEPEAPEAERPAEPEPAPDAPGITQAQSRKMHALFNEHGVTERDARLSMVAALIGREVASSSDLTKAEAGTVIDALESQAPEPTLDVEP